MYLLEAKDTTCECSPKKSSSLKKKKIANFPQISGVLSKKGHQKFSARSLACSNRTKEKNGYNLGSFLTNQKNNAVEDRAFSSSPQAEDRTFLRTGWLRGPEL